jgi:hypothetical protein
MASAKPSEIGSSDVNFINGIFKSLQAIFPAWRQAFPDDAAVAEAKRQWTMGLIEAGLTSAGAIKPGLALARKSRNPFIPSIGQFVGWCQDAAKARIGFPSDDAVIVQILDFSRTRGTKHQSAIHPVAYWIYQHVDLYALKHAADTREAKRILAGAYHEAEEKAAAGYEFPESPKLLPDDVAARPAPTAEQIAERERARAALKGMFRGVTA